MFTNDLNGETFSQLNIQGGLSNHHPSFNPIKSSSFGDFTANLLKSI
jgi:hypothetical protein